MNESVVAHSAFVAKMLETYILTGGNGVDEALKSAGDHITEEVKAVTAALDTPHGQVVQGFGLACREFTMLLCGRATHTVVGHVHCINDGR